VQCVWKEVITTSRWERLEGALWGSRFVRAGGRGARVCACRNAFAPSGAQCLVVFVRWRHDAGDVHSARKRWQYIEVVIGERRMNGSQQQCSPPCLPATRPQVTPPPSPYACTAASPADASLLLFRRCEMYTEPRR